MISYLPQALTFLSVGGIIYVMGHIWDRWYSNYKVQYMERTEQDLYGMFSTFSSERVLQWSIASFAIVFLVTLIFFGRFESFFSGFLSFLISMVMGCLSSLVPRWAIKKASMYRLNQFDIQLLDSLLTMSNSLKAGFSIVQSFEMVVQEGRNPIAQELGLFLRETRFGVKFEDAAENICKRVPSEDLRIVLTGIEITRQTGGTLTEVFDRLAAVIRERMRIQGRIRSLTAQGRLQGWVIGLMPFFLGFMFYLIEPQMMLQFISTGPGIALIFMMLCLQGLGFYFTRRIVTIDV